ncbi:MAG TPA: hypothetical protein VIY56_19825, partial [Vicinamibacterales bacterium]
PTDRPRESPSFVPSRGSLLVAGSCAIVLAVAASAGQAPTQAGRGAGPATPAAPGQPPPPAGVVVPRTFTGSVGLAFNTVRPDRVLEFETLLAEVQQALARSTNPATQAQAKAWRFFKAAEPGPNGSVMYVFVVDPVAPGEDYSLGKTLVEAFPDAAKLQEIWKLYTGSVTGGGSLVNLSPVSATPPVAPARGGRGLPDPETVPRVLPADRDPNR